MTATTQWVIAGGAALLMWPIAAAMVAAYGVGRGYPFLPLWISAVFLTPPVVLLVVTIAPGRQPQRRDPADQSTRIIRG